MAETVRRRSRHTPSSVGNLSAEQYRAALMNELHELTGVSLDTLRTASPQSLERIRAQFIAPKDPRSRETGLDDALAVIEFFRNNPVQKLKRLSQAALKGLAELPGNIRGLSLARKMQLVSVAGLALSACSAIDGQDPTVTPTLAPTLTPSNLPPTIDFQATVNALEGTITALQNDPKGNFGAQSELVISTSTQTLTPTPTRTPTMSVTPSPTGEIVTQPPTLTSSVTVTSTAEGGAPSNYHIPPDIQTGIHVNNHGLTTIDNQEFVEYLGASVNNAGRDVVGNISDFASNMLGEDVDGTISLDRSPNWWFTKAEGLGWTSEDPIHLSLTDLRNHFFTGNRAEIFSSRDGVYRLGIVTEARNFEQALSLAVILRYIEGAGIIGLSQETLKAFVEEHDAEIQATYKVLLSQSGYQHRTPEEGEVIQSWPGAWSLLQEDYNLVSNNGDVCETVMGPAKDRDSQREQVVVTEYRVLTEATTPNNDETINRADSDGQIFVAVTFDNNAPASSGGAYSPNDQGTMRTDIFSARTYESVINPEGTNPRPDQAGANWVETSFNRWVACGTGRGEVPVATAVAPAQAVEQPGQPSEPENPTQVPPGKETPRRPTDTPPTEETQVWPTPVPTNEHGGNENPIPTPTESYSYPTEPAPTVGPTRPAY